MVVRRQRFVRQFIIALAIMVGWPWGMMLALVDDLVDRDEPTAQARERPAHRLDGPKRHGVRGVDPIGLGIVSDDDTSRAAASPTAPERWEVTFDSSPWIADRTRDRGPSSPSHVPSSRSIAATVHRRC